jgi:hypothetical protein
MCYYLVYIILYSFSQIRLWDRVDLKGLSITSLIVPFRLFSTVKLENNQGLLRTHEVLAKLKPEINLEFIE